MTLRSRKTSAAVPVRIMLAAFLLALPAVSAAQAEVRFGRNVRVGGHDVSNQRFDRNRRAVIHLYDRTPERQGCVWRADGRGGKVKICHLRRLRR
ncbi:hypothetical protein [Bosea minatitlanensis]|uniref:Uncharacterized protein n=1 Tax=Bosea minatitlanensis TaxID=128782 RepID=A0ABW0EZV9_9HYPH|nr:hypothetical protein [Bosea minatitlanensis]MCT4492278.1 hypothetical protein [Bosea minatitlanensis]